jgi:hypothetical protein
VQVVVIVAVATFGAACAYCVFRLPFVKYRIDPFPTRIETVAQLPDPGEPKPGPFDHAVLSKAPPCRPSCVKPVTASAER